MANTPQNERLPKQQYDLLVCPICVRDKGLPYRLVVDGKLVAGCVSDYHSERVDGYPFGAWHFRKAAGLIRSRAAAIYKRPPRTRKKKLQIICDESLQS